MFLLALLVIELVFLTPAPDCCEDELNGIVWGRVEALLDLVGVASRVSTDEMLSLSVAVVAWVENIDSDVAVEVLVFKSSKALANTSLFVFMHPRILLFFH